MGLASPSRGIARLREADPRAFRGNLEGSALAMAQENSDICTTISKSNTTNHSSTGFDHSDASPQSRAGNSFGNSQALRTAVFTAFNKGSCLLQCSANSAMMKCAHVSILCYTSMSLTSFCRGSMRLQNTICATLKVLRLGAVM